MRRSLRIFSCSLLALVVSACGPGKLDPDGSSGADTSTGGGTTDGAATTTIDEATTADTSTTADATTTAATTTAATTTAATTTAATTAATTDANECIACDVELSTQSSTVLAPAPGNTLLGSASRPEGIVWAIDEVDAGRVAYAGTNELLNNEITQCGLWEWLADTAEPPRVLSTGNFVCDVQDWNGLGDLADFTFSTALPPEYAGDPAALRADFDVVVFCINNFGNPPPVDAQTYVDYVKVHGGGLYLAGAPQLGDPSEDIARINEIAEPLGVVYQSVFLDWAGSASASFACFPDQDAP